MARLDRECEERKALIDKETDAKIANIVKYFQAVKKFKEDKRNESRRIQNTGRKRLRSTGLVRIRLKFSLF
ncbi:unnamed protein product [Meloidogyne enterolobii]|uniref:Uncharacterized protein n=1 Tax=Meloidogyne enterolobii TaxID=390850 RepID=A0ACB0YZZ3_MELEN